MSLLIKGMEMPTDKRLTLQIDPNGSVYVVDECSITAETYTTDAVLIPPHGRLIDADALIGKVNNGYYCEDLCQFVYSVGEQEIKDAPTVIEAEGEK